MKFKRVALYALATIMLTAPVVGCASGGAGVGANAKNETCGFSKKQQLACLKKVWKAGIIDKEAYNREWARIVNANQVVIQACIVPGSWIIKSLRARRRVGALLFGV